MLHNTEKPLKIPMSGAVIILRDGGSNDPEILLSPLTYIYEHRANLEIMIDNAYAQSQQTSLDDLLMVIGNLIENNRSINGLAEWIEAEAPEFQQEAIEGAAAMRAATVNVLMRFSTTSPLL
ncbi:MAG: acyl-CoA transferase [Alphaproteobacteria bacterium]